MRPEITVYCAATPKHNAKSARLSHTKKPIERNKYPIAQLSTRPFFAADGRRVRRKTTPFFIRFCGARARAHSVFKPINAKMASPLPISRHNAFSVSLRGACFLDKHRPHISEAQIIRVLCYFTSCERIF